VSDREYLATLSTTAGYIQLAEEMRAQGKEGELLPRSADEAPISAKRFLSLAAPGGEDDMFSSDLTNDQMKGKLGHMGIPTLIVLSGADEYVPSDVNLDLLLEKLASAMPGCVNSIIVSNANHALEGHSEEFVHCVMDFLSCHVIPSNS